METQLNTKHELLQLMQQFIQNDMEENGFEYLECWVEFLLNLWVETKGQSKVDDLFGKYTKKTRHADEICGYQVYYFHQFDTYVMITGSYDHNEHTTLDYEDIGIAIKSDNEDSEREWEFDPNYEKIDLRFYKTKK